MTLLELLRSSFRLCGTLNVGQGPNEDDVSDALIVLNAMLESWSTERLNVFRIAPARYSLVALQQTYQIGPGAADFAVARPIRIDQANIVLPGTGGNNDYERPLEILSTADWASIPIKSTQSTIPTRVYLDPQFPISLLSFWPVPSVAVDVILWSWQAIQTGFDDVSVDISFPPGYADAIRYNLAVLLAPEWGMKPRPDVIDRARELKANIKRLNKPTLKLGCEAAMLLDGGFWNWLTGSSTNNG